MINGADEKAPKRMKLLVSDTQENRHAQIRRLLVDQKAVIAVLLAAADVEWTIRRAIIALGTSPTAYLRAGGSLAWIATAGSGKKKLGEKPRPTLKAS
jgi:hypothetical protein